MQKDSLDKNLVIEKNIDVDDVIFRDVREEPFEVYGLYEYKREGKFMRMPEEVAEKVSTGVMGLNVRTSGGRVRFSTDSEYVAIRAHLPWIYFMPHMPLCASAGFDLYIDEDGTSTYKGTYRTPMDMKNGYESVLHFGDRKMRNFTINFPIMSELDSLLIGVSEDAKLGKGMEYKYKTPVVFYGSSITHGIAASRPGNIYPSMISRMINCDYINLGFSGNAKGEDDMAEYIASLDMSVFVYDYDFNSPTLEHYESTHEKMFKTIRDKHKDLPVIFVSRPNFNYGEFDFGKRDILYNTYSKAFNSGDRNVYFIDGASLFNGPLRDSCTIDGTHPNDLGFYRMAMTIGEMVKRVIR